MSWTIEGRTVLITGAARGIGAATARKVRERGGRVALLGLEPEKLEELAAELGPHAAAFPCDVCDREAHGSAVEAAAERFGGIDVAIANAGIATISPLGSMPWEDFDRMVDVNLTGVYNTLRLSLPHVQERRGYLLPIASLAAVVAAPHMGAYPATKAAVDHLADTLRLELRPHGVAVGCGYFGFIDTDMVRKAMSHEASGAMQERGPKFLSRPIPVSAAAGAIVRGIEARSRRVYAPRWILPMLLLHKAVQHVVDLGVRDSDVIDAERIAAERPMRPTTPAPDEKAVA